MFRVCAFIMYMHLCTYLIFVSFLVKSLFLLLIHLVPYEIKLHRKVFSLVCLESNKFLLFDSLY